jgi:hypothetical protein
LSSGIKLNPFNRLITLSAIPLWRSQSVATIKLSLRFRRFLIYNYLTKGNKRLQNNSGCLPVHNWPPAFHLIYSLAERLPHRKSQVIKEKLSCHLHLQNWAEQSNSSSNMKHKFANCNLWIFCEKMYIRQAKVIIVYLLGSVN